MSTSLVTTPPSDQLLRTLASVPVSSPILHVGCGEGHHTEAFLRLGFPVHACDPRSEAVQDTRAVVRELVDTETAKSCVQQRSLRSLDTLEETFDWVIIDRTEAFVDSPAQLEVLLRKAHGLLAPGGWTYLMAPAARETADAPAGPEAVQGRDDDGIRFQSSDLEVETLDTDLVESRPPSRVDENNEERIHALYRRVKASGP